MFDLYIANKNYSSWSLRPWVLMKVLEIPFNEHLMPFEGGFGASHDTFIHFSPSGLVPCLVDEAVDDGLAVWDSLAIIEYLADEFRKDQGIDLRTDRMALQRLKEAAKLGFVRAMTPLDSARRPATEAGIEIREIVHLRDLLAPFGCDADTLSAIARPEEVH